MIRFLLYRPIAVLISTISLVVLGVITFRQIPVSLLPNIDVPEITVQVSYPSATARELQQSIVKTLRNHLQQVNHLVDIEVITQDGLAILKLKFDYGTNVHLAYIETNEKIDATQASLPRDMPRPRVLKANASDIPVFNLNVRNRTESNFLEISEFCENVIRRRIEQLPEVALVDMSGLSQPVLSIRPDRAKMQSLGLTEQHLANILRQNNIDLGNIVVKEGYYQYNIKFTSVLRTKTDVENVLFSIDPNQQNHLLRLKDVASVEIAEQKLKGLYTFNGQRAVCMSIIKQSDAQLLQLREKLNSLVKNLRTDYPNLQFDVSQDQTELLEISINNLLSNLLTGALLTFLMIFFFLNDPKVSLLIGVVIPVSLVVTFLGFYLLGLSINIVSLAGLVLGMGEIIDSAIIIIENIEEKRANGFNANEACIEGSNEVIGPLFTSILTNSAVFLPLIFLSGIAGSLFFDQAVAVSLALGVSLLCSYTLVPVLYRLMYQNKPYQHRPDRWLARKAEAAYNGLFDTAFRYKKSFLVVLLAILAVSSWFFVNIPKQGMPTVSQTELEIKLDWNEPLSVEENSQRLANLMSSLQTPIVYKSSFIGQQQFLLNKDLQQSFSEALVSLKTTESLLLAKIQEELTKKTSSQFPKCKLSFASAKNVFEQLFDTSKPPLALKVASQQSQNILPVGDVQRLQALLQQNGFTTQAISLQKQIQITVLKERLELYDVKADKLYDVLKTIFNENNLGNIKAEQKYIPILLGVDNENISNFWQQATVQNTKGQLVPVKELIEQKFVEDYKALHAGKEGDFVPLILTNLPKNPEATQAKIEQLRLEKQGFMLSFEGSYFKNKEILKELLAVILVSVALLFFILAAQFESLTQPLIVMITIAFGLSGAVALLWVADNSLNIMSAIGMVVLLGILDNDSILKIDTINRSIEQLGLINALKEAGRRRLKSQIMTFLTTILGVLPVLFSGGLGSELQQPLALSIIGGMVAGFWVSLTLIPILYYLLSLRLTK